MSDLPPELCGLIASSTGAKGVERGERIQSLWSGYGELFRVYLEGGDAASLVVKWARPPAGSRPGERASASHARKCRSYDVETAFYVTLADQCNEACRVPRLFAHRVVRGHAPEWLLCLEDLDAAGFSKRIRDPRGHELEACLRWLACFHARFMGHAVANLWKVGTYWHLATRRDELEATRNEALKARATELDRALSGARFKTLVHGDAKPANFCFAGDGRSVAAVDFQYVGGGVGVKDVAYLLYGSVSAEAERHHLDLYFDYLRGAVPDAADARSIEEEWRGLYGIAKDDFGRFLAAWKG